MVFKFEMLFNLNNRKFKQNFEINMEISKMLKISCEKFR